MGRDTDSFGSEAEDAFGHCRGGIPLVGVVLQRRATVQRDVMLGFMTIGVVGMCCVCIVRRDEERITERLIVILTRGPKAGRNLCEQAG